MPSIEDRKWVLATWVIHFQKEFNMWFLVPQQEEYSKNTQIAKKKSTNWVNYKGQTSLNELDF